jgi:hypothetical protein
METFSRGLGHIVLSRDQRKREELRLILPPFHKKGGDIDKALLQRFMESIHTFGRGLMAILQRESKDGVDLEDGLGSSIYI